MNHKNQQDLILGEGFDIVAQFGVRAFTVEALSKCLAMSKKTIYKFFPTKEKLILSITQHCLNQITNVFATVMKNEPNPAVQFVKIMETISNFGSRTSLNKLAELKALYPEIWNEVVSFHLSAQDDFYTILKNAQDQKLAYKDINIKSTAIVFNNIINTTFQPEFFLQNDLPIGNTIHDFVKIMAKGIFNEKGLAAIKEYDEQNKI